MKDRLIPSDQAAEYLGMKDRKTLLNIYRQLGIPHYKIGIHVMFRISELDKWLEEKAA